MTSVVERLAFRYRDPEDDDVTAQCPLALNGLGPFKGHCVACDNRLRPPRPYRVYDEYGMPIVSDRVDVLCLSRTPRKGIATFALR
jgi:hypothetical protein